MKEEGRVVIGAPWVEGGKVYNAAILLDAGAVQAVRTKVELPNYGVFDEVRVFARGPLLSSCATCNASNSNRLNALNKLKRTVPTSVAASILILRK